MAYEGEGNPTALLEELGEMEQKLLLSWHWDGAASAELDPVLINACRGRQGSGVCP